MIPSKFDGVSPLRVCLMLGISALFVMTSMIPGMELLTHPVRIFVTLIHELGHALASLFTGGSVDYLQVNYDYSGVTYTRGGWLWLIASSGYLGTTALGLLAIILISKGWWKQTALLFAGLCLFSMTASGFHSLFTTTWALTLACMLFAIAALEYVGMVVISFLSFQLLLNAFYDLKTLFKLSGSGVFTDAVLMSQTVGGFEIFWATVWILIAIVATLQAMLIVSVNRR